MSESQKPLQILDIFNTQNFITNKDFVTYTAQGLVTVPNGLKFGDGSYLNGLGDLYSVNGTLVLDLGTDGTDATFNGDVNGDLYGDIYNSSSTKVFDTDTQTFTGNVNAGSFTGNLVGNADTATKIATIENNNIVQLIATQTLTNKDITGSFTGNLVGNADTATKIATIENNNIVQLIATQTLTNKDITGSFTGNLVGNADTATKIATIENNNIVQTSGDQSIAGTKTFTSTMKIVETGGTYGSDSTGSLELYHGTGNASSIIFQGNGNDYAFLRYIDDWTNINDLNGYSDLLLGDSVAENEKSTLFIGTQTNGTEGGNDSIVIRPAASLVLDTGTSSSEVSTNAGNIYMKPNGGSVVIGQPDIEGVIESPRVTYQGVPLTVVALDSQTSTQNNIFEVLKLERKLNDIGNSGDPNNDGGGYIGMHVNDYNTTAELARIAWRSTNSSNTERSGKIEFYTANDSSQPTKRMTINYDGNVGIGTETPTSLLEIVETGNGTFKSSSGGTLTLSHANSGGTNSIVFQNATRADNYAAINYIDNIEGELATYPEFTDYTILQSGDGLNASVLSITSDLHIDPDTSNTNGGGDSILIRPSSHLILDTGNSTISRNPDALIMVNPTGHNGGCLVVGKQSKTTNGNKLEVSGDSLFEGDVTATSITDGTATLTGGALTGLTSLTTPGNITGNVIRTQNQPFSINYSTRFSGSTSSGPSFTFSSGMDHRACVTFRITAQVASDERTEDITVNNVTTTYNYLENVSHLSGQLTCYPGRFPTSSTWAPSTGSNRFYYFAGSGGDTTKLNNTPWSFSSNHGQKDLFGFTKFKQESTQSSSNADLFLTLTGINSTIQFICQNTQNWTSYQITVEVMNVNDYWGANDTITYFDTQIGTHNNMPIVIG
jgi:hypothetical protein